MHYWHAQYNSSVFISSILYKYKANDYTMRVFPNKKKIQLMFNFFNLSRITMELFSM